MIKERQMFVFSISPSILNHSIRIRRIFSNFIFIILVFGSLLLQAQTIDIRVSSSSDDAEEQSSGTVDLTSSDLELVEESSNQKVGMRFNSITIPQGATITSAWVQFQADETNSASTNLIIKGEKIPNSLTFNNDSFNISDRIKTNTFIEWNPSAWNSVGEQDVDQQTTDIKAVIQEIVDQTGWLSGNSLSIIVTGTGKRVAESFNGTSSAAPLLHVEYSTAGSTGCNLLANSEFDDATNFWYLIPATGNTATMSIDNTSVLSGINAAYIDITTADGTDSNIQFAQSGLSITGGLQYSVSFEAKSISTKTIGLSVDLAESPWTNCFSQNIDLTSTPTIFGPYLFIAPISSVNVALNFNLGGDTQNVWIDNVVFKKTSCVIIPVVDYNIDDVNGQTINTCSANFYDSGGPTSNYMDNEDYSVTFCADNGEQLILDFTAFDIENQSSCGYDYLKVYDGVNTSSTLIGKYCGTTIPSTITSTNTCLHIEFHSDVSVTKSGWEASISCTAIPCGDGITMDNYESSCDGSGNVQVDVIDMSLVSETTIEVMYNSCDAGSSITASSSIGNITIPKVATTTGGDYVYRTTIASAATNIAHNSVCGGCGYGNGLQSMIVFVKRTEVSPVTYTSTYTEQVGNCDVVNFSLNIASSDGLRDVNIKLPFTDIANDSTYLTISASSNTGSAVSTKTIYGPDLSIGNCCFDMIEMTILNVPANSTAINIAIMTNTINDPTGGSNCGQSWVMAGTILMGVNCCTTIDDPGSITGNQILCETGLPTIINNENIANSILGESLSYQWFKSTSTSEKPTGLEHEWELIIGATGTSYTPGAISTTTYFVRGVKEASCSGYNGYSNTVQIIYKADCKDVCFAISESGSGTLYSWTGTNNSLIGSLGASNVEAMTFNHDRSILYATNQGDFGSVNITTGAFTFISDIGTGEGVLGTINFSDVDGLAFNPTNGYIIASHRRGSNNDILFVINPLTGKCEKNYFGPGLDYQEITGALQDIDDLAFDPITNELYAVSTVSSSNDLDQIVIIDQYLGIATQVSLLETCDIEGLTFDDYGNLYGSTGFQSNCADAEDNSIYAIDYSASAGITSYLSTLANSDIEALACFVSGVAPCITIDDPGVISANQTICSGDTPSTIDNVTFATSTTGGVIEYQWYKSTTSCLAPLNQDLTDWTAISGATSATYTPGTITESTCYTRAAKKQSCAIYVKFSNVIRINYEDICVDCVDAINNNGNLEDEGTATNFDLSLSNTPALLIDSLNLPIWWGGRYDPNLVNTNTFQGSYYLNKTGTSGDPLSGSHYMFIKGTGVAMSALNIDDVVNCGATYTFSAWIAAYTPFGIQGDAPFKLEFNAEGDIPVDYNDQISFIAGASTSWDILNWQQYSFNVTIPDNGYTSADFIFTSLSDSFGIVIDDVCIMAIDKGSEALAGPDQFNCSNGFTLNANTPEVGYTGTWSVVSGAANISSPSFPTSAVTITTNDVATLRWTVTNGPCTSYDEVVVAFEDVSAISVNSETICDGETAILSLTGCTGTVSWSNGEFGNSITVSPLVTSTYSVSCTSALPSNSVLNPDFESGVNFENWNNLANASITTNPSHVHNGSKAALADASSTWSGFGQDIAVGEGAYFELKIWSKADDISNDAEFGYIFYDSLWNVLSSYHERVSSNIYTEYTITGVTPPTAAYINIGGSTSSPNKLYVDDVSFLVGIGCTTTTISTVTVNPSPTVDAGVDQTICPGETVVLSAIGGNGVPPYTFSWNQGLGSGSSHTVNPAVSTSYEVSVLDVNGCSATDIVTVAVTCSATIAVPDVCEGEDLIVTFDGMPGYNTDRIDIYPKGSNVSLEWIYTNGTQSSSNGTGGASGTVIFSGYTASNYEIKLFVNNSYIPVAMADALVKGAPTMNLEDGSICPGESIKLDPDVCETYPDIRAYRPLDNEGWLNQFDVGGSGLIGDGSLCFDFTDALGTTYNMMGLNVDPFTDANYSSIDFAIYFLTSSNNTIRIYESGAYKGQIYNSPTPFLGSSFCIRRTGTTIEYLMNGTVVYTSLVSSNSTLYYDNTFYSNLSTYSELTNIELCGEVDLNYVWSSGDTTSTINTSVVGTYTVTVTDDKGCFVTDQSIVTMNTTPTAEAGIGDTICPGETVIISGIGSSGLGPYIYTWDQGLGDGQSQTISPTSTTTYNVTVTDANGCTDTDFVTITISCNAMVSALDDCEKEDIIVTFNNMPGYDMDKIGLYLQGGGAQLDWVYTNGTQSSSNGTGGASGSVMFSGYLAGDYEVKLFVNNSTIVVDSDLLTLYASPIANAGLDISICNGDSTILSANATSGLPSYTFEWDNGLGIGADKTIFPVVTTSYIVTVTDLNGCIGTDSVLVTVKELPTGGTIDGDEGACGAYDPSLITSSINPTGTDCFTFTVDSTDCCDNGQKPISITFQYIGENCSESNNNQGSQGDKWDCTEPGSGPNGDPEVFISVNDGLMFSGTVSINGVFTVSNGGANLINNTVIDIYDEEGGTLLQTVGIHASCSVPIVTGDQFGSVVLLSTTYTDLDGCGSQVTGIFHQWQKKIENGVWTDIDGASGLTYDPDYIIVVTQYRRVTTNCCGVAISNIVTKTVNSAIYAFAGFDEQVCTNGMVTLTASHGLGLYQNGFILKAEPEVSSANKVRFYGTGSTRPRLVIYSNGNTTPTTLFTTQKARIESENTNHNHSSMRVGYDHGEYDRSLLDFDVSAISGTIDSSFVVLLPKSNSNINIGIYPLSSEWVQSSVTWDKSSVDYFWDTPGGLDVVAPLLDNINLTSVQDYQWDVTELVNTWVNGVSNVGGSYGYAWSTGENTQSITVSPLSNTTYTVTITDLNVGCTDTDDLLVEVSNETLEAGVIGEEASNCGGFDPNNMSSIIDASGNCNLLAGQDCCDNGEKPIAFLLQYNGLSCDDSNNNQGTIGGKWDCTGDAGGDSQVYISVNNSQFAGVVNMFETFTVSNGGSILTNPIIISVYDQEAGILLQTIEIHTSCSVPIVMEDQFGSVKLIIATYSSGETCEAPTLELLYQWQVYNNVTSEWDDISGEISTSYDPGFITETTKFRRLALNCCGQMPSNEIVFAVNSISEVSTTPDIVICEGDTTTISVTVAGGGITFSYDWDGLGNGQEQTVSPSSTTTYTVTVTDSNGCTGMDSVTVTVNPVPLVDAGSDKTICYGSNTLLTAYASAGSGSGYGYLWSNGASTDTITVSPLVTTDYLVTVTDINGCTDTSLVRITIDNDFNPGTINGDESLCGGYDPSLITGSVPTGCFGGIPQYQWQNRLPAGTWNDILGATAKDYDPTIITETYEFRRRERPNGGGVWTVSNVIIKTVWNIPTLTVNTDLTTCYGSNTLLTANGSGGSGIGYSYLWSTGAVTDTITVSPIVTTNYYITITDSNGCTDTSQVTITIDIDFIPGTLNGDEILCGSYDPTIILGTLPSGCYGGTPQYQWQSRIPAGVWSDISGAVSQNYNPSTITETYEYRRQVRPNGGGIWTISNTIVKTVWDKPIATTTSDIVMCVGASTSIGVTANGGSGTGYTYLWSNGATVATFGVSPIVSTIFIVTITDSNGCTDTSHVWITLDTEFDPGSISINESICGPYDPQIMSGTMAIGCSGGIPIYQWQVRQIAGFWSDIIGATSQHYDPPLITETYEYRRQVKPNGGGNWTSSNIVIKTVFPIPIVDAGIDQTICPGETITISASGTNGSLPYTYSWNQGLGNGQIQSVNPIVTTSYFLTLTDVNGCTSYDTITVNVICPATITTADICEGDDIEATFTDMPGYNEDWIGIYPQGGGAILDWVFTNGTKNNSIGTGGTNGNVTFSGYVPGDYEIKLFVDSSSIVVAADSLTVFSNPNVTVSNDGPLTCDKTIVSLIATPPGMAYLWSSGETGQTKIVSLPGTYTVTVTDVNGCNTIDSTIVTEDVLVPDGSINNDGILTCDTTLVVVSASSATVGVIYLWSNAGETTPTITISNPGLYTVTIMDPSNGCSIVINNTVSQDITIPNSSVSNDGPLTCDKTTVTLSASSSTNGVKYLWSDGGDTTTAKVVSLPGLYTVTITDPSNGCTIIDSSIVIEDTVLPPVNIGADTSICEGSYAILTVTGGATYSWSHGLGSASSVFVNPIISTTYAVTATGANGCIASDEILVTISPDINVSIDFNGDECLRDDSQLSANVTGGLTPYSYSWTGPNGFISTLQTVDIVDNGNYFVTVTDAIGCMTNTSGFVYSQYDPFIVTLNTEICEGDEVVLTVQAASIVSYQWGNNAGNDTTASVTVTPGVPSTSYTVTVTNNLGCTAVATVDIDVIAKPVVSLSGPLNICVEENSTLLPSSGGDWSSSNPAVAIVSNDGIITGVGEGSVRFIFTDSLTSCISDSTVALTVFDKPNVGLGTDQNICNGESVSLNAAVSGGHTPYTYVWNEGLGNTSSHTITPLVTTTYNVTITDINGCEDTDEITIVVNPNPIVDVGENQIICSGSEVTLIATTTSGQSPFTYVWDNGIGTGDTKIFVPSSTTTYSVTVTDVNGCEDIDDILVTVKAVSSLLFDGPLEECAGEYAVFTVTPDNPNNTYVWDFDGGTSLDGDADDLTESIVWPLALNGTTRTVTVYATKTNGCTSTISKDIFINIGVFNDNGNLWDICEGMSTQIGPEAIEVPAGSSFIWTPSLYLDDSTARQPICTALSDIQYTLTVGIGNCSKDYLVDVNILLHPSVDVGSDIDMCFNSVITMTASGSGGSGLGYTYDWSHNLGSGISKTVSPDSTTNYTVSITDSKGCQGVDTIVVTIFDLPILTFDEVGSICEDDTTIALVVSPIGGTFSGSGTTVDGYFTPGSAGVGLHEIIYSYTDLNLCSNTRKIDIDVLATTTAVIIGPSTICVDETTILSPTVGGIWSSSDTTMATVDNVGIVTGVSEGAVIFTFTLDNGCSVNSETPVTVIAKPTVSLAGPADICVGEFTHLSPSIGGIWTSNNNLVAIVSITGEVIGLSAGTAIMRFSEWINGCVSEDSITITVHPVPSIEITGSTSLCVGETSTMTPNSGGTWVSSDTTVATISNSGLVTAVAGGVVNFIYTNAISGCVSLASNSVIVHNLPIVYNAGPPEICVDDITSLSPTTGGTWISLDTSIATVTLDGTVVGVSPGVVYFVYTNSATLCNSDSSLNITVLERPIVSVSGVTEICVDETTTLSPTTGGSWISSNNSIATVTNEGLVIGIAAGNVSFTFIDLISNCPSNPTTSILIKPKPVITVNGSHAVCVSYTVSLTTDTVGVWSSSDESVATITQEGLVTAISSGTSYMTFTGVNDCSVTITTPITVFSNPNVGITGLDTICVLSTTSLFPTSGGIWTSSDEVTATVTSNGIVTGHRAGAVDFIFTETTSGCNSQTPLSIVVLSKPDVSITGSTLLCEEETSTLSPTSGGIWFSSNESVATVTPSGIVTSISQGLVRFTFVDENGCSSNQTSPIIVYPKPNIYVDGPTGICLGDIGALYPNSGGTWTSSDTLVATVSNAGVITTISEGLVTFIFTDDITSCVSDPSQEVSIVEGGTVNLLGPADICEGSTTQFAPTTGGVWVSTNPSVALIDATGLAIGISEGVATFIFTNLTTGCIYDTSTTITVSATAVPVFLGESKLCIGEKLNITPAVGGSWSSSNDGVAIIDDSGIITANNQGTARFYYTDDVTGCVSDESATLIVNGVPVVWRGGSDNLCIGGTTNLYPETGGTWISMDTTIATVDSTGLVTGVSDGAVSFVFTNDDTGCSSDPSSLDLTVYPNVSVSISGDYNICMGYTTVLSPIIGGVWVSSDPRIATVTNSGVVLGKAPGKVAFQFFESSTGCSEGNFTDSVTVEPCLNADFNVSIVGIDINSDLSTNDNTPAGTTYDNFNTITISKPPSSIDVLEINTDGSYSFNANKEGKYIYYVPVCIPPNVVGCPVSILEITVIDNIHSSYSPVSNIEFATTFKAVLESDNGESVFINSVSNDRCVNSLFCEIDSSLVEISGTPTMDSPNFTAAGAISNDLFGHIQYIPDAGKIGNDTLYYKCCVTGEPTNCSISRQIVTVNARSAVNSTVASDEFVYTIKGESVSGNAILNDSDPEGDFLFIVPQGTLLTPISVTDGSFYINSMGNFVFTPNENFTGNTEIIYTLCDNNISPECVNATIHILVLPPLELEIKVYLEGALMENNGMTSSTTGKPLMRDDLRNSPFTGLNYIETRDPHTVVQGLIDITTKYNHKGPGTLLSNQIITDSVNVFNMTGDDAIVDWVFVELRSKDNMNFPIASRSGLLQRDGDVVDLDGLSPLAFQGVDQDSFYIVVKHRLHLGVMSMKVSNKDFVDFTDPSTAVFNYGNTYNNDYDFTGLSQNDNVVNGYNALWAGDFDSDGKIKFSNPYDDLNALFFEVILHVNSQTYNSNFDFAYGYSQGDYNMNSKVKYDNPNDDKNLLYAQIIFAIQNTAFLSNFDFFIEQVPPRQE